MRNGGPLKKYIVVTQKNCFFFALDLLIYVITLETNNWATFQTLARLLVSIYGFKMSHHRAKRTDRTVLTPKRANWLSRAYD